MAEDAAVPAKGNAVMEAVLGVLSLRVTGREGFSAGGGDAMAVMRDEIRVLE